MDYEELSERLAEVRRLEIRVQRAKRDLRKAERSVLALSDVKVGDIVEVNGVKHTGKEMYVTRIDLARPWGRKTEGAVYAFKADGLVINKNGKVGRRKGRWESRPIHWEEE